ncbi:GntR family transcriptional regulator [Caldinitratiruptor microaerophilus]|uniref:GntR family transcriptional regulator n=2 Tax=Caldinitratiruptor microaerophilus TaxID=671077 RepID=A0AA35CM82_9FIRM|nr:GntR family transcriptional regulator [Caldinitratiruptor microaerophilus]
MGEHMEPVDRELLTDRVAGRLRTAIEVGHLRPGQRLVEIELSRELGVSRAPLREALRQLEKEGLVENKPGRGCVVVTFTPADVEEIYSLRSAIEALAARLAAARPDPAALDGLDGVIDRLQDPDLQYPDVVEIDLEFHDMLCRLPGHRRLHAVFRMLRSQTRMLLTLFGASAHDPELVVRQHRAIVDALRRGDGEAAARAVLAHLADARADLLAALGVDPTTPLTKEDPS